MSRGGRRPADTIGGMSGVSLGVAIGVMLSAACLGCQRRAIDSSTTSSAPVPQSRPRDLTSLPRAKVTLAQRTDWRRHLLWPDDCEEGFRASHAGDDGGIRVVLLGAGVSLVEVTCAAGAYQPSTMRFALTEDANGARTRPLVFPVYTSDDGRSLTLSNQAEVWGDSVVNGAAAEIAILSLARQTADCGVWARYSLTGDQPRLLAAAARTRCPASPGPPASVSGSGPPPGWATIPGKD